MARLTASNASRNFADVLTRAAAGEEFEVTRGGRPVASIGPPRIRLTSAERFREIMQTAPSVDDDFANDLRSIRGDSGPAPEAPHSPS
jgi:prevent-host-death family protein